MTVTKTRVIRISYYGMALTVLFTGILKLGTPVLTILFSTLALRCLTFFRRKWVAAMIFVVLVMGIFDGFVLFLQHALETLPRVANHSVPAVVEYARSYGFELPFSDAETLRVALIDGVSGELGRLANFAKIASKEFLYLIVGFVIALSVFLSEHVNFGETTDGGENNLYSALTNELLRRFSIFYRSFEMVIGAQIVISAINTFCTAVFVVWTGVPNGMLIVVITFLCGLLPIIGNLISNTVIVGIGITVSTKLAVAALIFLVVLHKLEYFLNSKIIGSRIKNPMWLTLLALLVGELVMGIPGMILAPVLLHYIKVEASSVGVEG